MSSAISETKKVRLVTIGDEILIGQIIDSNSAYIAQKLDEIGLEVFEIVSIHDDLEIITETLERLSKNSDVIITTGGLGPTRDDITKKALCNFLDSQLIMDEEVLLDLTERFEKRGLRMNSLNRDQALVPEDSTVLKNPLGSAPGIWSEKNGCIIINLQGVPFEMKNMIKTEVIPRLQNRFSLPFVIHRHLSVSGIPESELALKLENWEDNLPGNIHLAYLPERGKVKLRITASGENKIKPEKEINSEVEKLKLLLGENLDSADQGATEEILGKRLKELNLSISTAESCTGGKIAQMLTSISGSSAYYKGTVVSYATSVKKDLLDVPEEMINEFTVVSKEVAVAMAEGVRKKMKTDIAVSTTGVAGPAKGEDGKDVGTVWIAITNGNKTFTKKYFFSYLERDDFILHVSRLTLLNTLKFIKEE